jgi:hypothetical protein
LKLAIFPPHGGEDGSSLTKLEVGRLKHAAPALILGVFSSLDREFQ